MMRVDSTDHSHVVKCSECSSFARLASSQTEGWKIAADHERRAHVDSEQARSALRMHETRRAAV